MSHGFPCKRACRTLRVARDDLPCVRQTTQAGEGDVNETEKRKDQSWLGKELTNMLLLTFEQNEGYGVAFAAMEVGSTHNLVFTVETKIAALAYGNALAYRKEQLRARA